MLRITLDARIEELEQQFETAHLNYLQQTGPRTHEYKDLAQNDKILTEDIEKRKKKIDALQVFIYIFSCISCFFCYGKCQAHINTLLCISLYVIRCCCCSGAVRAVSWWKTQRSGGECW